MNRAGWVRRAEETVVAVRDVLEPYGVEIDTHLTVCAEPHPIPGYVHDDLRVSFCPPVVASPTDRLRWVYYAKFMGCGSVEEAAEFYAVALPYVVAHELAHHVRFTRALAADSPFVEEQVCDIVATAWVRAIPEHRDTLEPLRRWCGRMRRAIEARAEDVGMQSRAFLPDLGAALVHTLALSPAELRDLRSLSRETDLPLPHLLAQHPAAKKALAAAERSRAAVRTHLESRYTEDPEEYWYLKLTWVESYLAQGLEPSVSEVVRRYLTVDDAARPAGEVAVALRRVLLAPRAGLAPGHGTPTDVAGMRAAALSGLLEIEGDGAVDDVLSTVAASTDEVELAALARMLSQRWPASADGSKIAWLWRGPEALTRGPTATAAVLRLAGGVGATLADAPGWRAWAARHEGHADLPQAEAQLMAAGMLPVSEERCGLLLDMPDVSVTLLEAWLAWRGGLEALPVAGRGLWPIAPASVRPALGARLPLAELILAVPPRGEEHHDETVSVVRGRLEGGEPWPNVEPSNGVRRLSVAVLERAVRADARRLESISGELIARASGWATMAIELDARRDDLARVAAAQLRFDVRRVAAHLVRAWVEAAAVPTAHRLLERELRLGVAARDAHALVVETVEPARRPALAALLEARPAPGVTVASSDPADLAPIVGVAFRSDPDPHVLSIAERVVQLRHTALFSSIEPMRLWEIAELCVVHEYGPGEFLFHQGDEGDELFLVLTGAIDIERRDDHGARTSVASLGPGATLGEMAVFEGAPRSADARAHERCRVMSLSGRAIAKIGRAHPEVYEAFLHSMSERLRETTARLAADD